MSASAMEGHLTSANDDAWLVHRGRFLDVTFLLEIGASSYLVRIHRGRIEGDLETGVLPATAVNFSVTFIGCILGIVALAAALSRFFLVEMKRWEQALCFLAALLLIAPGLVVTLVGVAILIPIVLRQVASWRLGQVRTAPA